MIFNCVSQLTRGGKGDLKIVVAEEIGFSASENQFTQAFLANRHRDDEN